MKDDLVLLRRVYKLGDKCDRNARSRLVSRYRYTVARGFFDEQDEARAKLMSFILYYERLKDKKME